MIKPSKVKFISDELENSVRKNLKINLMAI